eukprot:TRINITY_DN57729_c0_g1_i1.p1 TRINITY_DN57729_c0_g1~~TRINITY_DN57729_c0_g1_i1.p1  ORF type:complete len:636 (+),score=191.40 TRINITY_DN57729_c0_g1_i1:288-1910(+)
MVSYLILIGDTMSPVLGDWTGSDLLAERKFVVFIGACGICLPLSSFKDIGALGKTSAVSILCVLILTLLICVRGIPASQELGIHTDKEFGWLALGVSPVGTMENATMILHDVDRCLLPLRGNASGVHDPPVLNSISDPSHNDVLYKSFASAVNGVASLTVEITLAGGVMPALIYAAGSKDSSPSCGSGEVLSYANKHDLTHGSVIPKKPDGVYSHKRPYGLSLKWHTHEDGRAGNVTLVVGTDYKKPSHNAFTFAHKSFFPALGVISFAYVCHHSSFLVRNSMKNKSDWNRVVHISVFIATAVSLLLAIVGYSSFQRCTRPDILNNFASDDQAVNVARFLLAITMFFTFPMEFFVVRQAVLSVAFEGETSNKRHWLLTAAIFGITLPPGLFLQSDQLGLVLEFTGGIAASLLGFIMPGAVWLAYRRRFSHSSSVTTQGKPADSQRRAGHGEAESEYVQYSSPEAGPPVTGQGAGLGLPAGGGPPPTPWREVVCGAGSAVPMILFVGGILSLLFNTGLGFVHAAGVDTYEYPAFCPDTGVH